MKNIFDAAYDCITAMESTEKVQLSQATVQAWQTQQLNLTTTHLADSILVPGQPSTLRLVSPRDVPHRNLATISGQAALLHALTHIEFNAINLAWDAVYRFRDLPVAFYDDWVKVAAEETRHFLLLQGQLQQLGYTYGDFVAHNGLWEMAVATAHDVLDRMAMVPRVLEARGLDVTPSIIAKVQSHGIQPLVEILHIILQDEIGHVAIGSYWFTYCCVQRQLNPETTFQDLLVQYFQGRLKQPFNVEARLAAGFSEQELESLTRLTVSIG